VGLVLVKEESGIDSEPRMHMMAHKVGKSLAELS